MIGSAVGRRGPRGLIALLAAGALAACGGDLESPQTANGGRPSRPGTEAGEPGSPSATPGPAGAPSAGGAAPAAVRRLTMDEVLTSLGDLFLGGARPAAPVPRERSHGGFENFAAALGVDVELASRLQALAETVAAKAAANPTPPLPCASPSADAPCAAEFIESAGLRTWRRPVSAAEKAQLLAVFEAGKAKGGFTTGIATVIEALIQSPYFLFRSELGEGGKDVGKLRRLGPYEIAAALSYFLWGTTPDDALLAAAAAGQLETAAQVEAQARRLLASPRAQAVLARFVTEWFALEDVAGAAKPDEAFTPKVAAAMAAEARRFVEAALAKEDSLASLLTARETFPDGELAPIYGVAAGTLGGGKAFALDGVRRRGLFTLPAFLAAHTHDEFSPIFLGKFVRTKLLCQPLADPPENVPSLPKGGPDVSTRARLKEHVSSPECDSCHRLMDPIGFGFERFDALGRHRETEGKAIPLSGGGALEGTDVDGPFTGPVELADRLARSRDVEACLGAQLLSYALGRTVKPGGADDAVLKTLLGGDARGKRRLRELVVDIVKSDAFVLRDASVLAGK